MENQSLVFRAEIESRESRGGDPQPIGVILAELFALYQVSDAQSGAEADDGLAAA